jgi:hypothetical protein
VCNCLNTLTLQLSKERNGCIWFHKMNLQLCLPMHSCVSQLPNVIHKSQCSNVHF